MEKTDELNKGPNPGPVEEFVLENNKLVVDGEFAFARYSTLNYSCKKRPSPCLVQPRRAKEWSGFTKVPARC